MCEYAIYVQGEPSFSQQPFPHTHLMSVMLINSDIKQNLCGNRRPSSPAHHLVSPNLLFGPHAVPLIFNVEFFFKLPRADEDPLFLCVCMRLYFFSQH